MIGSLLINAWRRTSRKKQQPRAETVGELRFVIHTNILSRRRKPCNRPHTRQSYGSPLDLLQIPSKPSLDNRRMCATMYYMKMNTLTIRIPDDLRADLDEISSQEHVPVSDLVRESIRRYVAVERFRALRKKTLPFAEAQGLLTDEDVFRAIS